MPLSSFTDFNYPAVFNFGDSNSHNGGFVAGFGFHLVPPNGQIYFKTPSGRFSDGRPNVDFLSKFLTLILEILYAVLNINIDKYLPTESSFQKGLWMFDIGKNYLSFGLLTKTLDEILPWIPIILLEVETGIKGPGTDPSKLDQLGCLSSHYEAAKDFNLLLHALYKKFQGQYADAKITHVDIVTVKFDLIANYSRYGFKQPMMACCGYGGPPFNFDSEIICEAANKYVALQILTGKYFDHLSQTKRLSFGTSSLNRHNIYSFLFSQYLKNLPITLMFDLLAMASKFLFLQIIIFSSIVSPLASSSRVFNYPAVFNFGDSNSDTGEMTSGLGMGLDLPYGEHYFKKPAGRACDGRLIVDFLSKFLTL
ncbi:hypothetical protein FEM48_Zijuj02G0149300 [Ziziphus jujuba var. spinosa]|uniref:GDSL esterase/lipase n=1 Tax=Ziziphus jujuba var. spinosa TaxID=714518 RepID=A0A978VWC3_ZIZJJ|nr:hypothetical protein FEM48_Zijuj02G0149300 [Ziziphus jujuba var. spinosa]